MENTRNKPARQRLPLAVYLAFLLVAALAFTGASFASYKTVATGSDSARVARFAVAAAKDASQSESLTLDSSTPSAGYKFTVSNTDANGVNETATKYDVVVKFPTQLTGVTLTLTKNNNNTQSTITGTVSADNKTFTFADAGSFTAGVAQTDSFALTFAVGDGAANAAWNNINIIVNAAQVD